MAQLPDLVGTDIAAGKKLAAPDASPRINQGAAPDGMALSTVDAHDEATPIDNSGQAVSDAAQQANQVILQQTDAAQKTWLLNASSQHELDAQNMLATAQRNAQPGQEITPILSDALNQKMATNMNEVDSPILAQNYQNEMTAANKGILSQAQAFDFHQRDVQVEKNFTDGISAQQKTLSLMNDPGQIEQKFGEMMAGVNQNIASLPLAPDVKLKLQDYARQNLTGAANTQAIALDPKGFLARNTGTPQESALQFIQAHEGEYTPDDAGKGPTLYGINSTANPTEYASMKAKYDAGDKAGAQSDAADVIQKKYIDQVVTPNMSPQMAMVASDTAVNMGVGAAKKLIAQSGGDPQKLLDLRNAKNANDAQTNPDLAADLPALQQRTADLKERLSDVAPRTMPDDQGNPTMQIGGWAPMQLATYDERNNAIQQAQQASTQQDKQQQQVQAAQNAAFNSDFDIQLGRGQKTYQDIENAYNAGQITPAQRTQYTQKLDEFNGNTLKGMAAMGRVTDALGGGQPLDPKNADDRSAVDRHFQGWLQAQPQPQNDQDKAALQSQEVAMSGQYGMVPKTMLSGLRGSLRSGKPDDVANASNIIEQLRQTNPNLLNDIDNNDLKASNHIAALVQSGYTPNAAVGAAQQELKVTPDVKAARNTEADEILHPKGWLTSPDAPARSAIGSTYSTWNPFGSTPNKSFSSAAIPDDMTSAWNTAYKSEYVRTGNPDAAAKSANDLIVNNGVNSGYGKTGVGGGFRWMMNAPESHYAAPVQMSQSDQADWMNEQLAHDVNQNAMNPAKSSELQIVPSMKINPDGNPTYNVWHQSPSTGVGSLLQGKDGAPMEWYPDWNSSQEKGRYQARVLYRQKNGGESPLTGQLREGLEGLAD